MSRGEQEEGRREDRPRPFLRVAEEAPGPLAGLDARRGQVGQLAVDRVERGGHQVQEDAFLLEAQRRPVELVVRDEARMPAAAAAVEVDLEDGRVLGPRKLRDPAEGRERDPSLPPLRAGEAVSARECVEHAFL